MWEQKKNYTRIWLNIYGTQCDWDETEKNEVYDKSNAMGSTSSVWKVFGFDEKMFHKYSK